MQHEMTLQPPFFSKIEEGSKTIEVRLYDEKRKQVKVGDKIVFYKLPDSMESIIVEVTALYHYPSFRQLYENHSVAAFGYPGESIDWLLKETYKFYTPEKEKKYGVLGIGIKLL